MPSILEGANAAAKAEGTKAALDDVAKNKLRAEVGLDGNVSGSISTMRKGFTFTAYVKALVKGPQKSVSAGGRIEKEF